MSPEEGWLLQIECECKDGRLCSSLHGDTSVRVESKAYLSLLPLLQTPHLSGLDQNPQKYPMRASKVLSTREIQPSRPTFSLSPLPSHHCGYHKKHTDRRLHTSAGSPQHKNKSLPLTFLYLRYLCNHHHLHQASTRLKRSCHA